MYVVAIALAYDDLERKVLHFLVISRVHLLNILIIQFYAQ